ncbi:transglycosylase domain-containing protein [Flammeovirga pacifica]|uniref:Glycosyl transferase family 51 domain-containing protein n=1 Tax=Flammeovirga pacifica TaxID=915059 RepID=A0A1S1Z2Q5_FLAPC|nr:transglycosylase domain-containing protein [Flammeovirga pacifica]OHX67522.1 hypothetical protein NH26_14775 [Flammeovirga pacifica]
MIVNFLKRLVYLILGLHFVFAVYIGLGTLYIKWANPTLSPYMIARANFDVSKIITPQFRPLSSIPTDLTTAIMGVEDPDFYFHNGYSSHKTPLMNANISQKVVRNMFLIPHNNNLGAYLECIGAVEMECLLGKERIFEVFMNYVEWGDNVYGIGEAADYYYKKDLQYLSRTQKLKLASVLANPIEVEPATYRKDKISEARFNLLNSFMN